VRQRSPPALRGSTRVHHAAHHARRKMSCATARTPRARGDAEQAGDAPGDTNPPTGTGTARAAAPGWAGPQQRDTTPAAMATSRVRCGPGPFGRRGQQGDASPMVPIMRDRPDGSDRRRLEHRTIGRHDAHGRLWVLNDANERRQGHAASPSASGLYRTCVAAGRRLSYVSRPHAASNSTTVCGKGVIRPYRELGRRPYVGPRPRVRRRRMR